MICSLDNFVFESLGVNLSNIQKKNTYQFDSQQPIDGFEIWQATGRYKQELTLNGKLIQHSNGALNDLHRIAEQKKAVTLAYEDGRALSVLILEINTEQSHFLQNGQFLKQDFDIKLAVIDGNV